MSPFIPASAYTPPPGLSAIFPLSTSACVDVYVNWTGRETSHCLDWNPRAPPYLSHRWNPSWGLWGAGVKWVPDVFLGPADRSGTFVSNATLKTLRPLSVCQPERVILMCVLFRMCCFCRSLLQLLRSVMGKERFCWFIRTFFWWNSQQKCVDGSLRSSIFLGECVFGRLSRCRPKMKTLDAASSCVREALFMVIKVNIFHTVEPCFCCSTRCSQQLMRCVWFYLTWWLKLSTTELSFKSHLIWVKLQLWLENCR